MLLGREGCADMMAVMVYDDSGTVFTESAGHAEGGCGLVTGRPGCIERQ